MQLKTTVRPKLHLKAGAEIPDIRYVRHDNRIIDVATMQVETFATNNLAKLVVRQRLSKGSIRHGQLVAYHFHSPADKKRRLAALHQAYNTRTKQRQGLG